LLEKKLAACINMLAPIHSLYTWDNKINRDQEFLLIVKSRAEIFQDQLVPAVQKIHPYEVPEIIALPILMGSESYLDWMSDATRQD
jgi:periplasmic divalent cation tolerance protein